MENCKGNTCPKNTVMEDRSKNIMESNSDEEIGCSKDQKLESAKGKIEEVREENERLKSLLSQLVKDYQSLQMHFLDILQQDQQQQGEDTIKATGTGTAENIEENEFVSLSLGMTISKAQPTMDEKKGEDDKLDKGLALGLDIIRFDPSLEASAETINIIPIPESNSNGEGKEEEASAILPPSKALKTMRSGDNIEATLQTQLKKARFSVRVRCDTQTMNDGCQWRKYGQKMARGNPCPRAYYRCTLSPSCPVRKQVQRCAEDMSILITTYEGTHNHPLPFSATAMASTTSAVASMLQSPYLSSQPTLATSDTAFTTAANNLHALNFSSCSQISRPQQFCFPNFSSSTTNSHPTITLDLTAPPLTSSHNAKFASGFSNNSIPKFSSKSLNFASNFYPSQSSIPESCWNTHSGYFNYGTKTHDRNQSGSLLNSGKQPFQGNLHQPNYVSNHTISQETISAAATKAVTVNSKSQSALAAALTTYLNNNGLTGGDHGGENSGLKLKLGGDMYSSSPDAIGYASSSRYLNVSSSVANVAQQGKLVLFPPSLPSPPASKSASGSLSDRSNQLLEYRKRRN